MKNRGDRLRRLAQFQVYFVGEVIHRVLPAVRRSQVLRYALNVIERIGVELHAVKRKRNRVQPTKRQWSCRSLGITSKTLWTIEESDVVGRSV